MRLAERSEYEYPHTDWVCKECGAVYSSRGPPDTDFCAGGHHMARWRPADGKVEEYIGLLESLTPGDVVVVCGQGPAPLKGTVRETHDQGYIAVERDDSPARLVAWDRSGPEIAWANAEDAHIHYSDVYHVEKLDGGDG